MPPPPIPRWPFKNTLSTQILEQGGFQTPTAGDSFLSRELGILEKT